MDLCRDAYFALRDEIVRNDETIRSNMRAAYRAAGLVAYQRLRALMPDNDFGDSEAFAETFAARILANVPPIQEISASFRFEISLSYIPLPSLLAESEVADLMAAEKVQHVDSLQPPFSMLFREAAADVIPWCLENNTGVIAYSPMASGILTGAYTEERAAALADEHAVFD